MDGSRPRLLVTNDDGVHAPGIRWLARAARDAGYDVTVAAPVTEASGMSAALTAVTDAGRVLVTPVSPTGLDGVPAFAVAASPAYIALLAGLAVFGPAPDLVLSGINRGANAGRAVLHSGTVGAAFTAAAGGARALAVSLDVLSSAQASATSGGAAIAALDAVDDEDRHWSTAAVLARRLLPWLAGAPAGTVVNLNVPDRPAARIAGLRRATLAPFGQVRMAVAESGADFVRMTLEQGDRRVPGSDIDLLARGYATVTAVRPPGQADDVVVPADAGQPGERLGVVRPRPPADDAARRP